VGGLPITLMLAIYGTLLAFPLGVLLALGRRSQLPIIRSVSIAYIELRARRAADHGCCSWRRIMFALFLPEGVSFDKLLRAQIAIILFKRGVHRRSRARGLQSLPRGQYEAPTRSTRLLEDAPAGHPAAGAAGHDSRRR